MGVCPKSTLSMAVRPLRFFAVIPFFRLIFRDPQALFRSWPPDGGGPVIVTFFQPFSGSRCGKMYDWASAPSSRRLFSGFFLVLAKSPPQSVDVLLPPFLPLLRRTWIANSSVIRFFNPPPSPLSLAGSTYEMLAPPCSFFLGFPSLAALPRLSHSTQGGFS